MTKTVNVALIGCLDTRLESKYHVPRHFYPEFNEATNCSIELNVRLVCFHRQNEHTLNCFYTLSHKKNKSEHAFCI